MCARASVFTTLATVLLLPPVAARGQSVLNLRPVAVLSQLDIDGDGAPDGAADTDGDGLPDNWEGGDDDGRLVGFPAPSAIGPGTPPTFILARQAVTTAYNKRDTDGDGLTDFIEVFGLKFIDDNHNGKLDFFFDDANGNAKWDPGEEILPPSEWLDANGDGLPSIGEYPLDNSDPTRNLFHDFDGFFFTDPTLKDTDGDGRSDGEDVDPLINPQTFGIAIGRFVRDSAGVANTDVDLDNDGLGNGSDFGNDDAVAANGDRGLVDFPEDVSELVNIFRQDLQAAGKIPESVIEDLLGVDWDGNGLFRVTDIRDPIAFVTINEMTARLGQDRFDELFRVGSRMLMVNQLCGERPCSEATADEVAEVLARPYGDRGIGLGLQELLLPPSRSMPFFPDVRIWTILYAWRMPGFDIDGDGFVGFEGPNSVRDEHAFTTESGIGDTPELDGRIEVPFSITLPCGALGLVVPALFAVLGVMVIAPRRGRRARRPESLE